MTDPQAAPADQPGPQLGQLRTAIDEVHDLATREEGHQALQAVDERVASLRGTLAEIHATAVPVDEGPDRRLDEIATAWATARTAIDADLRHDSLVIADQLSRLDAAFTEIVTITAAGQAADDLITAASARAASIKDAITASDTRAVDRIAPTREACDSLADSLAELMACVERFAAASFTLEAGEHAERAVDAERMTEGWGADIRKGVLYLTDRRLLFEEQGPADTRTITFQETLASIAEIRATHEGFLGHEDHIYVRLVASPAEVHFHLFGSSSPWARPPQPA